jgi:hypothetical protein
MKRWCNITFPKTFTDIQTNKHQQQLIHDFCSRNQYFIKNNAQQYQSIIQLPVSRILKEITTDNNESEILIFGMNIFVKTLHNKINQTFHFPEMFTEIQPDDYQWQSINIMTLICFVTSPPSRFDMSKMTWENLWKSDPQKVRLEIRPRLSIRSFYSLTSLKHINLCACVSS